MRLTKLLRPFLLLLLIFVPAAYAADVDTYDDTPELQARVARIRFMRGDVQMRRDGTDDWELATNNLPLLEGDQIATGPDARVELQLDSYNYVRLAANTFLTLETLRDNQIALSLPEGTISARVLT